MWVALARVATAYHHLRAGLQADPDRAPGRVACMREFPQPKGLEGAAASGQQDQKVLRWRRLSTLVAAWPRGDTPNRDLASGLLFANTLTKVRMEEEGEWRDLIPAATSLEGLRRLLERAKQEMQQGAAELARFRRQRWSTWCAEQVSKGAPKLFKWVRDGSKELTPPRASPTSTQRGCSSLV